MCVYAHVSVRCVTHPSVDASTHVQSPDPSEGTGSSGISRGLGTFLARATCRVEGVRAADLERKAAPPPLTLLKLLCGRRGQGCPCRGCAPPCSGPEVPAAKS